MSTLNATATCRTCHQPITFTSDSRDGRVRPHTGWSDDSPSNPLVCFSAASLTHSPVTQEQS